MLVCILEDNHIYILFLLLVVFFYRSFIFKRCVLFMFKKTSGNICMIEKKLTINHITHELTEEHKEVLNVAHANATSAATLYIVNPKFYELFFLKGEEGFGESFVKEYIETENLDDLLQIVNDILNCSLYKKWFAFYSKLESCFYKHFQIPRTFFTLDDDILKSCQYKNELPYEAICFTDHTKMGKIKTDWEGDMILHNGLYDFNNTFIQKLFPNMFIMDYYDVEHIFHSNNLKIERLERNSGKFLNYEWETINHSSKESQNVFFYYTRVLKFLFKNNYISLNHLFCKK